MKKALLIFFLLFLTVIFHANAQDILGKPAPINHDALRDQAEQESEHAIDYESLVARKKNKKTTLMAAPKVVAPLTPQQAGVLNLADPFADHSSNWHWMTSFLVQDYTPNGTGSVGDLSKYEYAALARGSKVFLTLGRRSNYLSLAGIDNFVAIEGAFGISSKDVDLPSQTSSGIPARIQSMDLSILPSIHFPISFSGRLAVKLLAELGYEYFSVASRSSVVRFNDIASFFGGGIGLHYTPDLRWSFQIQQLSRYQSESKPTWTVSSSNFQLGVSYLW